MNFSLGSAPRNRLDHVLPRGYLAGFTNPSIPGELWVWDRSTSRWFPSGTPAVAAIKGFYDYSPGSNPDQTADSAFQELEEQFPNVRRELIAANFSGWQRHRDFLLGFAQMLRARSELFRRQSIANTEQAQILRVLHVGDRHLTYEPYVPTTQQEHSSLLRNKAITDMRSEIRNGAASFLDLDWCLRMAVDPEDPIITGDNPIVLERTTPTVEEALQDSSSSLFFPVCWQACLVGCRGGRFHVETDVFHTADLRKLRRMYTSSADRFAYSPSRFVVEEEDAKF